MRQYICRKPGRLVHVSELICNIQLRRVKLYVSADTLQKGLVQPLFKLAVYLPILFQYSSLWENCGKLLKDNVQKIQSSAALKPWESGIIIQDICTQYRVHIRTKSVLIVLKEKSQKISHYVHNYYNFIYDQNLEEKFTTEYYLQDTLQLA